MTKLVLSGQRLWVGDKKVSSQVNALSLTYQVDPQECTSLEDDTHVFLGGLASTQLGYSGFVDYANADPDFFADIGLSDVPVAVSAVNATAGSPGYFFNSLAGDYTTSGSIGDLFAFSVAAVGRQVPIRGQLVLNEDLATTDVSTGLQIGAVTAGKSIYAQAHIISVAGSTPTLDLTVQRDVDNNFSSPENVMSFTQFTAAGYEQISDNSVATDQWYRISYAASGTFSAAIFIGVR